MKTVHTGVYIQLSSWSSNVIGKQALSIWVWGSSTTFCECSLRFNVYVHLLLMICRIHATVSTRLRLPPFFVVSCFTTPQIQCIDKFYLRTSSDHSKILHLMKYPLLISGKFVLSRSTLKSGRFPHAVFRLGLLVKSVIWWCTFHSFFFRLRSRFSCRSVFHFLSSAVQSSNTFRAWIPQSPVVDVYLLLYCCSRCTHSYETVRLPFINFQSTVTKPSSNSCFGVHFLR